MDMIPSTFRAAVAAALVVVLLFVAPARSARAQAVTGTLLGSVTDDAGLAIPSATVTITEINTNITTSVITNENGNFVFSSLKNGVYRVEAEREPHAPHSDQRLPSGREQHTASLAEHH